MNFEQGYVEYLKERSSLEEERRIEELQGRIAELVIKSKGLKTISEKVCKRITALEDSHIKYLVKIEVVRDQLGCLNENLIVYQGQIERIEQEIDLANHLLASQKLLMEYKKDSQNKSQ